MCFLNVFKNVSYMKRFVYIMSFRTTIFIRPIPLYFSVLNVPLIVTTFYCVFNDNNWDQHGC